MNSAEFSDWLDTQQPALDAFGKWIVSEIQGRTLAALSQERATGFFKINPGFRPKAIASALVKQAKKKYEDPTHQMTDLVGARFVVLLRSDIAVVERALMNCNSMWTARRDREPKMEADVEPDAFRYQSVHYIVRNIEDKNYDGVIIPAETACEVQIRTLLQHAYAELGHDRIYKGSAVVPPSVHRIVARSMALMETTDHLFCEAVEELDRINKDIAGWCNWLDKAYQTLGPPALETHDDEDAILVIQTFKELLASADHNVVGGYFQNSVVKYIRGRPRLDDLFSRPIVMLVYWLISHHTIQTVANWPLPKYRDDLDLIAADLGIALD